MADLLVELLQRFGVTREQWEECRRIRGQGSSGAAGTLAEATADLLDGMRGKPPGEILVARGHLDPGRQAEFEFALEQVTHAPDPATAAGGTAGEETGGAPRPPRLDTLQPESLDEADPSSLPRRFGKFDLVGELGRGGMGRVYKAFHPGLKTHVALKVLLAGDHATADQVARFHREAVASAKMHHPGILPVYDVGEEDGKTWIAMEYVEGASLDRVLGDPLPFGIAPAKPPPDGAGAVKRRRPGISPSMALRWTAEIADALQAAHDAGVVHRDLKPANVLRDAQGRLRVMDFGLARLADASGPGRTAEGTVLGTPEYMSPEQAEGRVDEVDAASDVYQVGAILYELLTGRPPYSGGSPMEIVLRVMQEAPRAPRRENPSIPRDAETICLKAMARDKVRRYASARDLAQDCRRFLDGDAILARPPSWWERPLRWAKRRKALTTAAGVAVLAVAVAGAAWWRAHSAEQERAQLAAEVLGNLRAMAADNLDSALMIRRAGGKMPEVAARFLPPLRDAVAKAIERAPGLAEPHHRLGRMYRALLQFGDARAEQDRALAKEPDHAPSRYERAVLLAREYTARLWELRAEWARSEGSRLARSGALAQGGMGDEAVPELPSDDVLAAGDPTAQATKKALVADLQWLEEAAAASGAIPALSSAMLDCLRGLYRAHAGGAAGRAEAETFLRRAVEAEPAREEAVEALAQVQAADRRWREVIATLDGGLEADKGYVAHWSARGEAELSYGKQEMDRGADPSEWYARAEADFGHALGLDGGVAELWRNRGGARVNRGVWRWSRGLEAGEDFAKADADFSKAIDLEPRSAECWLSRAQVRMNVGSSEADRGGDPQDWFRKAEADCSHALELDPRSAKAWLIRGFLRANVGDVHARRGGDPGPAYASAVADFDEALKLDPRAAAHWLQRGRVHCIWGEHQAKIGTAPDERFGTADADFGKAIELEPGLVEAWWRRGAGRVSWGAWRTEHGGDADELYRRAMADYEKAIELNPGSADVWLRRGLLSYNRARYARGRREDGAVHFRDAEAAYGKALELNSRLATAWWRRGETRSEWGIAVSEQGGDPTGLYGQAAADLDQALEIDPRSAEALSRRGALRSNRGRYLQNRGADPGDFFGQAEADYGKAIELDPNLAHAWRSRGVLRRNLGLARSARGQDPRELYRGAVVDYTKAIELDPGKADTWRMRGVVRLNLGQDAVGRGEDPTVVFSEAEADLCKALALHAGLTMAWIARGDLGVSWAGYLQTHGGNAEPLYAAAEEYYGQAQKLEPALAEAWLRRGDARLNRGVYVSDLGRDPVEWYTLAAADYGKAIELDPGGAEGWTGRANAAGNLGYQRMNRGVDPTGEYRSAEADLSKALEIAPGNAFAWLMRANLRVNWGDHSSRTGADPAEKYREAEADFDRAAELNPRRADVWWRRGRLRWAMRRWADAVADFEAASRIDPSCVYMFGAQLADARTRLLWREWTGAEPAWVDALLRAEFVLLGGDYAAAGDAYTQGLSALETACAALSAADRDRFRSDPSVRQVLAMAHYNLACVEAVRSTGRTRADGTPLALPQAESARRRDLAFQHLGELLRLGLSDVGHLRADGDLAPLHDDPRWDELLKEMERLRK